jgi:hypothetical protein
VSDADDGDRNIDLSTRMHCGELSWRFDGPIDWCTRCGALRINDAEWTVTADRAVEPLTEEVRVYLGWLHKNRELQSRPQGARRRQTADDRVRREHAQAHRLDAAGTVEAQEEAMKDKEKTFVEIVEFSTDKVVKRLGPMTESKADRVQRGMDVNLDHDRFFTRTVEA